MYDLGITPSRGRPRVSNDNAYSESLFRTLKYCPQWPQAGFPSLDAPRAWVRDFMLWYNTNTGIAESASSRPLSGIVNWIIRSWRDATSCTNKHERRARNAGQGKRETGNQCERCC